MYIVQCNMFIVHMYNEHVTLQCTMYHMHCDIFIIHTICIIHVHCTVYNIHCTRYHLHYDTCIMHTLYCQCKCTLYNDHCTVYNDHCTLYIVHCTTYHLHCDTIISSVDNNMFTNAFPIITSVLSMRCLDVGSTLCFRSLLRPGSSDISSPYPGNYSYYIAYRNAGQPLWIRGYPYGVVSSSVINLSHPGYYIVNPVPIQVTGG